MAETTHKAMKQLESIQNRLVEARALWDAGQLQASADLLTRAYMDLGSTSNLAQLTAAGAKRGGGK